MIGYPILINNKNQQINNVVAVDPILQGRDSINIRNYPNKVIDQIKIERKNNKANLKKAVKYYNPIAIIYRLFRI